MKYRIAQLTLILACSMMCTASVKADGGCRLPMTELESGIVETDLGNVKIKTELYNHIAKVKLIGEVNEDWSSVSTEGDTTGLITGYLGNGSDAQVVAELIIKQTENGFQFAIFKTEGKPTSATRINGTAYFFNQNKTTCISTTYQKWVAGRTEAFGDDLERSSINLQRDGFGGG